MTKLYVEVFATAGDKMEAEMRRRTIILGGFENPGEDSGSIISKKCWRELKGSETGEQ